MTTLTMQDEKRIEIIQRVFRDELTMGRAAVLFGDQRAAVLPDQSEGEESRS